MINPCYDLAVSNIKGKTKTIKGWSPFLVLKSQFLCIWSIIQNSHIHWSNLFIMDSIEVQRKTFAYLVLEMKISESHVFHECLIRLWGKKKSYISRRWPEKLVNQVSQIENKRGLNSFGLCLIYIQYRCWVTNGLAIFFFLPGTRHRALPMGWKLVQSILHMQNLEEILKT